MYATAAAGAAALAAALLAGAGPSLIKTRLGNSCVRTAPAGGAQSTGTRWATRPRIPVLPLRVQMSLGACAGALIGALAAPPGGVLVGAVAGPAGITFSSHRKRRALLKQRRAAVAEACLALAGELRNGQAPEHALQAAATEWPEFFGPAVGRAAAGGDPALALRHTAAEPGAAPLSSIAAAWEVSNQTGASLSAVLTAVTDSLRAEESVRREAEAQLASVRATSRLLAILPVATLLLFSTSGTERTPVEFLLESPYGMACLATAAIFIGAGLAWVERTSRHV
jgi:tight adherence protein B